MSVSEVNLSLSTVESATFDSNKVESALPVIGFPNSPKTFQVKIASQKSKKTDFSWYSLSKVRGRWDRIDERNGVVDSSARTGRRHVDSVSTGRPVILPVTQKCDISYRSAEELGISEEQRQEMLQQDQQYIIEQRDVDLTGEKVELEFSTTRNSEHHSFKTVPMDRISFQTTRLGQLCGRNEVSIKVMQESINLGADTLDNEPLEVDRQKMHKGLSGYGRYCIGWFKVAISGEKIWMVSNSSPRTDFIKSAYQTDNTLMVNLA
ncbi:hypothetical protein SOPP22_12730 [Shewanella sp. OPT22]|nr:hypothetical protein SOPP22_12730 [Shewanella sp. OPT22]